MPIYEYACGACGHHLEALQKMTEAPLRKCPHCGKSQLRLKGGGWYETDFKNKNETKRNLVEKGGAEASEASSDKSTDTSAKDAAGKAVAEAKSDAPAAKPDEPKESTKPTTRKPASKPRAKAARR